MSENFVPQYFAETEKAVKLKITVYDYDLKKTITCKVWVPKSQLSSDGRPGEWITEQKALDFYKMDRERSQYEVTWTDAAGNSFCEGQTQREKKRADSRKMAFERGCDVYADLLARAKAAGVKGVRRGMKTETILRKMRESGIDV